MLSMAVLLIAGAAAAQEVQSAPIDLAVTYWAFLQAEDHCNNVRLRKPPTG
jgi:hypothetical protein